MRRSRITAPSPSLKTVASSLATGLWDLVFRRVLRMTLKNFRLGLDLGIPGLACLAAGLLLLAGFGTDLHPLLQESGAGLVLLVSGVALVGARHFRWCWPSWRPGDGDPPASPRKILGSPGGRV